MRTKRLLLAASALSTLTFGCSKAKPEEKRDDDTTQPLPGNPKGTFYDDAAVPVALDATITDALIRDAGVTDAVGRDAGVTDAVSRDAGVTDARVPADAARDAGVRRRPPLDGPPLKSNPKGSLYDKGHDKNDPGL